MSGFGDDAYISTPRPERRGLQIAAGAFAVLPCVILIPAVKDTLNPWGGAAVLVVSYAISIVLTLRSRPTRGIIVDADGITLAETEERPARHLPWAAIEDVRVHRGRLHVDGRSVRLHGDPAELFAAIERHSAGRLRPR